MGSKFSFLAGAAVGYVLGSRAGRPRYEQIKTKSQELWQSDPVQTKVSEAGGAIKSATPVAAEKVGSAAKQVGGAAKSKLTSDSRRYRCQRQRRYDVQHRRLHPSRTST